MNILSITANSALSRWLWQRLACLRMWRDSQQDAPSGLLPAALHVTDEEGRLLVDDTAVDCGDYLLRVELPSGPVVVDLYEHYLLFASTGGEKTYHGHDCACRTYVKFGACIQDKLGVNIRIRPAIRYDTRRAP